MLNKRMLIMAGGTGGHVFPALAVATAMQKRGFTIEWLGTRRGMEAELVPKAGFPIHFITVTGLRRSGILKSLLAPFRLFLALLQALFIIYRFKPSVVLGMGGFASGPGGVAAWLLKVPLVIHEQNAIAGVTNCLLAKIATRVLEGFPGSFERNKIININRENQKQDKQTRDNRTRNHRTISIKEKEVIFTGNPVREALLQVAAPEHRFAERMGPLNILVLGGSQGAKALNELCPVAFTHIPMAERPFIKHQTGTISREATEHAYKMANVLATVEPFIHDMAEAYAWADIVICRAGALTVAELAAVGVGSILVPFPFAVDDHQTYNGRFLEEGAAAQVISQTVLNPSMLADIIMSLSRNRNKVLAMALAAKGLSKPDALENVVTHCIQACK